MDADDERKNRLPAAAAVTSVVESVGSDSGDANTVNRSASAITHKISKLDSRYFVFKTFVSSSGGLVETASDSKTERKNGKDKAHDAVSLVKLFHIKFKI
jgi:hypothetical protein